MRKTLFFLLLICMLLPAAAMAASYTFPEQGAVCTISDSKYTIITPENVADKTDWLAKQNKSAESIQADFAERGVLLQAWANTGDMCIEISAVKDLYAQQYYDINQVTDTERKAYRVSHATDKTGEWREQGYDYDKDAAWKKYKYGGRFLQLDYSRTVNGQTYRGYARKTVRNGWHIQVECQVFDRSPKTSDRNALDAIMTTWEFIEVSARPVTSATKIIFTSTPPQESNTGKFTIAGTGSSGLKFIGVAMRMSTREVHQFEAEINNKGKFELDVKLPKEGYWLMTYTVKNGETVVEEGAFDPITYDDTLLPLSMNSELPATMTLTGNELVISGTTLRQTNVQCIVDGRNYDKTITTNNTGKFSFTIDTSEEGLYTITLRLQKKGYDTRRFRCDAVREFTEEDRKQSIRDEAIKPSYKNLLSKLDSYRGRYMVYTLNVRDISQTATGYLTFAGMTKTKSGAYKEIVVIRTSEEPTWAAGRSVRMYLKCLGTYDVVSDDGTESYPYFDFQWTE